MNMKGMQI